MSAQRHHSTTGEALLSSDGRKIAMTVCGGRCAVCRKRMFLHTYDRSRRLTIDHITAHANGGGADGNLAPLCGGCNSSKRDRDLAAWLPSRLVTTGRAKSIRGARRMVTRVTAELLTQRDALTAAMQEEGI